MDIALLGLTSPSFGMTLGVLFLRISLGTFFVISGYHKLFNVSRHATVLQTMEADHVFDPNFNAWFVPVAEFAGGAALFIGFLTPLAALGLFIICCGATIVDGLQRIIGWKPVDRADYLDDILYLPEALYAIMLAAVALMGSGPISIDRVLFDVGVF